MQKLMLIYFIFIIAFIGCKEVDVIEGRVPSQYLPYAKQLAGVYTGSFDNQTVELEILFNNDQPEIRFRNALGDELYASQCHSHFEMLQKVYINVEDGHYHIDQAIFGYNPGFCSQIQGRTITLSFLDTNHINIKLFKENKSQKRCLGSHPGGSSCHNEDTPQYITGSFSK
jgi:hypothetical protein